VLEPLGKFCHIGGRKQRLEVNCLRRIASENLDRLCLFEGAGDFVAGEKNREFSIRTRHPFGEFPLSVGIGPVNFI
jgi:hypothetical protein